MAGEASENMPSTRGIDTSGRGWPSLRYRAVSDRKYKPRRPTRAPCRSDASHRMWIVSPRRSAVPVWTRCALRRLPRIATGCSFTLSCSRRCRLPTLCSIAGGAQLQRLRDSLGRHPRHLHNPEPRSFRSTVGVRWPTHLSAASGDA